MRAMKIGLTAGPCMAGVGREGNDRVGREQHWLSQGEWDSSSCKSLTVPLQTQMAALTITRFQS